MEIMKVQRQTETKVKCPRWEKDENVKNFLLQLLDSERRNEKQRIELEEQNGILNPENENIIQDIIEKMQKWYGKTKTEEASDAWRDFRRIFLLLCHSTSP